MKRILCALLAVVMLCTMAVSMVSCFASIDKMEENCKKLKEDGEIVEYHVATKEEVKFYGDKAVAGISAFTKDYEETFIAIEFEDKDAAKEYYEEAQKELDEMTEEEAEKYVVKCDGKIVIAASKDLYKKIA